MQSLQFRRFAFSVLFLSILAFPSCSKQDTLRIYAGQQNGDPAFGADIRIYPSETNYLQEPTPVITGKANQADESGAAFFELEDLFSGAHFYDVIFRDSIGNWAIDGADKTFSAISKGGESIEVGGYDLGLNYHRFLLPGSGQSTWRLSDIEDGAGNSIVSNFPACVRDNSFLLTKDMHILYNEGADLCPSAAQEEDLLFSHGGNALTVNGFSGQSGAVSLRISPARSALIAQIGSENWVYVRD